MSTENKDQMPAAPEGCAAAAGYADLTALDQGIAVAVGKAKEAGVPEQAIVGYLEVWAAHVRTNLLINVQHAISEHRKRHSDERSDRHD